MGKHIMLTRILEHKITFAIAAGACIIVVAAAGYFLLKPQTKTLTGVAAQVRTIQQTVAADGQIDSNQHISLSFPASGRITAVNVAVGDSVRSGQVLATMDSAGLQASLEGARADVLSAEANLASLQQGATVQTKNVYVQGISTTQLALSTAINDAYLKVQDALLNKISGLFENNTSLNPILMIPADSYNMSTSIQKARADLTGSMADWNSLIQTGTTSDATVAAATTDIISAKSLLDSLSYLVNRLSISSSGLSQQAINADVTTMNGAESEVNAAQTEFNSALQAYKTSIDQLNVVAASSTPETLQIGQAALAKAQANAASIESQIANTTLVAPFDGVVASVNPRVGDNFPSDQAAIDVISPGAYKIDVMIPENQVSSIAVGDQADISFDGSGTGLTATGTVSSIDLSETMSNGVGAYKATVRVNGSDPRIRTGMSAHALIHGATSGNVVAIPASAVIEKNGSSYALVMNASGSYVEQQIQTGLSDGDWTEVTSGVQAGQVVAAFGGSEQ